VNTLHIAGSGAIGTLLAGAAARKAMSYALYPHCYPNADTALIKSPAYIQWIDGVKHAITHKVTAKQTLSPNDTLIFPLKVHQLEAALREWKPYLHKQTPVVLLHNGMGGYEIAQQVLAASQPLLLATTSHGAMKCTRAPNSSGTAHNTDSSAPDHSYVIYTGVGVTQIGIAPHLMARKNAGIPQWVSDAQSTLHTLLPPVEYQADIMRALWNKLAVNVVINPLTALNNVTNSHIAGEQFALERRQLCEEFTQVANACGQHFDAIEVEKNVLKVATLTAKNYSSMHQDVSNHRPTEINAINGYIVKLAQKKGIDVPLNTLLTEQITARGGRA